MPPHVNCVATLPREIPRETSDCTVVQPTKLISTYRRHLYAVCFAIYVYCRCVLSFCLINEYDDDLKTYLCRQSYRGMITVHLGNCENLDVL